MPQQRLILVERWRVGEGMPERKGHQKDLSNSSLFISH